MSVPVPSTALSAAETRRLHAVLDEFEAALAKAPDTDLAPFLPPRDDPNFHVYLLELVKADIYFRCRAGDERPVERALAAHPELRADPADLLALVWEEYLARRRIKTPDPAEYQRRFPEVFRQLRDKIASASSVLTPNPSAEAVVSPTIRPGTVRQSSPPPEPPTRTDPGTADRLLSVGGGYRLHRRIGAGSFGEVWRAEAPGGVEVAVKIISRPLDHDEAKRELYALELIKQLRHPFLLSTQAFWPLDDRLVIVMELADGSLSDRLTRVQADGHQGIPRDELLAWMRESCEAIDFLHDRGVIHRDVKPANILTLGKHIKVADFGLARAHQVDPTMHKTTSGTPAYMAPELWYGDAATPASDLYALAVTYAELRLGHRLFTDTGLVQMMVSHLESVPDLAGMEAEEVRVVRQALAKEAKNRHKSCLAFWKELNQALDPVRVATEVGPGSVALPAFPARPLDRGPHGQSGTPFPPPPPASAGPLSWKQPVPVKRARPTSGWRWGGLALALVVGAGGVAAWQLGLPNSQTVTEGVTELKRPNGSPPKKDPPTGSGLPAGFVAVPNSPLVQVGNRQWPKRIVKTLPGGEAVEFLLVNPADPSIRPFYMMRFKVWKGLLRAYQSKAGLANVERESVRSGIADVLRLLGGAPAAQAGDDCVPAYDVGVDDAQTFCKFLGGDLPTAKQWDAAGGRFENPPAAGPFRDNGLTYAAGEFALQAPGVGLPGPLPVGLASRDVSAFGCHDMAANGYEWTRTVRGTGTSVPFDRETNVDVALRGHAYVDAHPFQFKDADLRSIDRYVEVGKPTHDEYTTFRAVIDLPE